MVPISAPKGFWSVLYTDCPIDQIIHPAFDVNASVDVWSGGFDQKPVKVPLIEAGINDDLSKRDRWFDFVDELLNHKNICVLSRTVMLYYSMKECPQKILDKMIHHPTFLADDKMLCFCLNLAKISPSANRKKACISMLNKMGLKINLSDVDKITSVTLSDKIISVADSDCLLDMIRAMANCYMFCVTRRTINLMLLKFGDDPRLLEYLMHLVYCARIVVDDVSTAIPVKDARVASLLRMVGF